MNETNVTMGYIISPEGEFINELYQGDRIIRNSQSEYLQNYISNFNKEEAFVKMFTSPIIELYKTLSTKESAVLLSVIPFISYSDGVLRYNGKVLSIKNIVDLLDENYDVYSRTLRALIAKNILARTEIPSEPDGNKIKKCIVANPFIFMKGQDVRKWTVDLFK